MGTFGWGELLVILLIVLAVFGTSRIAGLGSALGSSIREFKKAVRDDEAEKTSTEKPGESVDQKPPEQRIV